MMQSHAAAQMLQSPARLGITNPNSPSRSNPATPKLSSQTPQHQNFIPHHHQQQQQQQTPPSAAALTTAATTSSTLIPLLPPFPRAQALLLQMASLATRLFDVSPNRSMWLSSYRGSLPTFLPSQNLPYPTDLSSPSSTKEILSLFTSLQTQLFEAVSELQEILDLQDAQQKIAQEIRSQDSAMRALANKLKEAEHVLDVLVDDYSDYRRPKRPISSTSAEATATAYDGSSSLSGSATTITSSLRLSEIMSYAHRISYTTFAPPEFGAGVAPLRGALPPAPQEEQMRASQLYIFADMDVGLPRTVESKEKTIDTLIEAPHPQPQQPTEANPLVDLAAIKGLIPTQLTVPSGWRPGMPVELPTDLPLVPPPGWKPGDPVPLTPLDSIALPGNRDEQQQPRAVVPNMPPPNAPEPIQVRHVQLDINPDEEDYSSDYSSDVGSSEEDDD